MGPPACTANTKTLNYWNQKKLNVTRDLWTRCVTAPYLVIPIQNGLRRIFEAVESRNNLFVGRPQVEEVRMHCDAPMLGRKYVNFFWQRRITEKLQQLYTSNNGTSYGQKTKEKLRPEKKL